MKYKYRWQSIWWLFLLKTILTIDFLKCEMWHSIWWLFLLKTILTLDFLKCFNLALDHSSPASCTPARQCHPSSHSPSQLWSSNYQTSALNPRVSASLSASPAPASDHHKLQQETTEQVRTSFVCIHWVVLRDQNFKLVSESPCTCFPIINNNNTYWLFKMYMCVLYVKVKSKKV